MPSPLSLWSTDSSVCGSTMSVEVHADSTPYIIGQATDLPITC